MQAAVDDKTAALEEARYELREAGAKVDYQKGRIGQLENEVQTNEHWCAESLCMHVVGSARDV